MQYLNVSLAKEGYSRWRQLTEEQRLTIKWGIATLLVSVVFWISQYVMPESPTAFRYFVSLYAIDSLVFFLIFRQYLALGKTILVFLFSLEIVVTLYYGFNYLSAA